MLLKLVEQKRVLLDSDELKASDKNLKAAYKILTAFEKMPKAKVLFSENIKDDNENDISGQYIIQYSKNKIFPVRLKNRIIIRPDKYWLLSLIHEFSHQILVRDLGYYEHGHLFRKTIKYLINRYFDNILTALLETQDK